MSDCKISKFSNFHFLRTGCADLASPLGGEALQFHNSNKDFAMDYLQSDTLLPDGDFSVQFYMRTYAGGCNGIPLPEGTLPKGDDPIDPAKRSLLQSLYGGTVMANCPGRVFSTGFSIQCNQPQSFFTVNFQTDKMDAPVSLRGMREICDDIWHLITVNVQRDGLLSVYCDDQLLRSADISAHAGESLGNQPIFIGCDTMKLYGLGKVDLAHFALRNGVIDEKEIASVYQYQAVLALAQQIRDRRLEACPIFDQAAVATLLEKTAKTLENLDISSDCKAAYESLQTAYEEALLCTVKPDLKLLVVADTHCDEAENHRTVAFRNALKWSQELGIDAMIHAGDYSQYGRECDFKGFWDSMRLHFNDKPFFLTIGNHETLHNDTKTLCKRQCDWLREFHMVDENHDKMYYEGEVNGHHVLVLCQYYDYEVTGYKRMWQFAGKIDREQMDWIREKVNAYCGQGKPVFLVIHNAHGPLLKEQSKNNCTHDSIILRGDELYDILRDHKDIIFCTGHVHHGLGAISGLFPSEGYHVLDITGFKNGAYGRGYDESSETAAVRHPGYFLYVFGRTVLLRAVDFATREWLPVYDQIVTLP